MPTPSGPSALVRPVCSADPVDDADVVEHFDDGRLHGPITPAHRSASVTALQELCRAVSGGDTTSSAGVDLPLHVRLTHLEDDGYLSPGLLGLNLFPTDGVVHPSPFPPAGDAPSAAVHLHSQPLAAVPYRFALVANQTVAGQVETALRTLGSLVQRQQLARTREAHDIKDIDLRATAADRSSYAATSDVLRNQGWRGAAEALRHRASAAGTPLQVTYAPTAFNLRELQARAPMLRYIYNTSDVARREVDKVAAAIGLSGRVESRGSTVLGAFARRMLDVGHFQRFCAHLMRDALVCGNGYLSFGRVPHEDVRLLPPERTALVTDGVAVVVDREGREEVHREVLHLTGIDQFGSPYGASVLEPYVATLLERDVLQRVLAFHTAHQAPADRPDLQRDAEEQVEFAHRRLQWLATREEELVGASRSMPPVPAERLYFPGWELMQPAAPALGHAVVPGEQP